MVQNLSRRYRNAEGGNPDLGTQSAKTEELCARAKRKYLLIWAQRS